MFSWCAKENCWLGECWTHKIAVTMTPKYPVTLRHGFPYLAEKVESTAFLMVVGFGHYRGQNIKRQAVDFTLGCTRIPSTNFIQMLSMDRSIYPSQHAQAGPTWATLVGPAWNWPRVTWRPHISSSCPGGAHLGPTWAAHQGPPWN